MYNNRNNNSWGNNYNNNYNNNQKPKRMSGARQGVGKNGKPYISGWKKMPSGLLTFIASPLIPNRDIVSKQTGNVHSAGQIQQSQSKSGKVYETWIGTLKQPFQKDQTFKCFKSQDGKLRIPELKMVLNPNLSGGGYFGKSRKPKS